jgi:DNA-binding response OmpR family regulator
MSRVLLVEDDRAVREQAASWLEQHGFAVVARATLRYATERGIGDADLAIVDRMLPDGDGLELVRAWRAAKPDFPMILLTARATLTDKLVGLELGANDYLTKPFEPLELVARIRRLLVFRAAAATAAPATAPTRRFTHGAIALCAVTRTATFHDAPLELTKMLFNLLRFFLEHPGVVFTRDEILTRVWGLDAYPTTRTVDNHVAQLRQKTDAALFETVHGVGYRLRADAGENGADA